MRYDSCSAYNSAMVVVCGTSEALCPPTRLPPAVLSNPERALMTSSVFTVLPVNETTYRLIYRCRRDLNFNNDSLKS